MRRIRYSVAASLDGFITDRAGGFDWIPNDPTVDFESIFANVDTVILGRRTYDDVLAMGSAPWKKGARIYVFSRTLQQADNPTVTISDDPVGVTRALREEDGSGEIWLFGGGALFGTLLAAGQVDAVEVTIVPVLLGAGTPVVTPEIHRTALRLTHSHVYPTGMVAVHYSVEEMV
jgi:dihydrofolate reductase